MVEHKSFGKDLGKAESQAFRYIQDLARDGRVKEIPRYVMKKSRINTTPAQYSEQIWKEFAP